MFKNSKHAFWEALLLTVFVFMVGIFLGISYEASKFEEISSYYDASQISLMDSFVLSNIVQDSASCDLLIDTHLDFADRIYEEAFLLEKYEASGKLTQSLKIAHRKYDLMRTLLWIDVTKTLEKCSNEFSIVVYLYEYEKEDLVQKAEQQVWSKILFDLKQQKGSQIILIPIAVDSNLVSLDSMIEKYDILKYPAVIIDNEYIITEIKSVEDLKVYLE